MAIIFKHLYKSDSLIGTGTYKFRPYTVAEPLPQLATPQNVSVDGTTVSWDEVENATSYAVLADGSEIGTVQNQLQEIYNISISAINCTVDSTSDTQISKNGTATLIFYPNDGYDLPENVVVSGATSDWYTILEPKQGFLTLSNPTENVSIEVNGVEITDELTGIWTFNEKEVEPPFTQEGEILKELEWIVSFDSFGVLFSKITYSDGIISYYDNERYIEVYTGEWIDGYQHIEITSKLSEVIGGDILLTWLQANATKQ